MTDTSQPDTFEIGEYVWFSDDQGRRRTAVVSASEQDGGLIVTGVGLESRGYSWRVSAEGVAARLTLRTAEEGI